MSAEILPHTFIILAAGQGSRMNSPMPKVMHELAGKPLIGHIFSTFKELDADAAVCAIIPPKSSQIEEYCRQQNSKVMVAYQAIQKGTADAVMSAKDTLSSLKLDKVIIMAGDIPLVEAETLQMMLDKLDHDDHCAAVVLAMHVDQPNTYGRLILDCDNMLEHIVEVKDASFAEQEIKLCNSSVMAIKGQYLFEFLAMIKPSHITQEYYLTDVIKVIRQHGLKVAVVETAPSEVHGINTQHDLAVAQNIYQTRLREKMMIQGVSLVDPDTVYFSHDTQIGCGVTIQPNVVFGPGVVIESGVEILSFSHIEGALIKSGARIGPFARIRPRTIINENAYVGNFVEVKNTHLGMGSKIGHLAYLGDAIIGQHCNIGAGAIIVNYDGINKWPTHIKDDVFVGSNSSLVAPVTIDNGAVIAAGSTITKNVASNALAFGRARQLEVIGGATKLRQKNLKHKST